MAQDFAKSFYHSARWQKCRAYILRRDHYLCQCYKILGGNPCGEPAVDVHHIIELTPGNINDRRIALSEENLIAVNDVCHREKITRKAKDCIDGFCFDDNGLLVPIGGH